jgi:hypothetical protein
MVSKGEVVDPPDVEDMVAAESSELESVEEPESVEEAASVAEPEAEAEAPGSAVPDGGIADGRSFVWTAYGVTWVTLLGLTLAVIRGWESRVREDEAS